MVDLIKYPSARLTGSIVSLAYCRFTKDAADRLKRAIDALTVPDEYVPPEMHELRMFQGECLPPPTTVRMKIHTPEGTKPELRMRWYLEAPKGTYTEIKEGSD